MVSVEDQFYNFNIEDSDGSENIFSINIKDYENPEVKLNEKKIKFDIACPETTFQNNQNLCYESPTLPPKNETKNYIFSELNDKKINIDIEETLKKLAVTVDRSLDRWYAELETLYNQIQKTSDSIDSQTQHSSTEETLILQKLANEMQLKLQSKQQSITDFLTKRFNNTNCNDMLDTLESVQTTPVDDDILNYQPQIEDDFPDISENEWNQLDQMVDDDLIVTETTKQKLIENSNTLDKSTNSFYPEWAGLTFPFSKDIVKSLVQVFGLRIFRTNQIESINATMSGLDTFILMPTGGGKSLCYQIPAISDPIINSVTIVISPLISLIQDQIQKLCSYGIGAAALSTGADSLMADKIESELRSPHSRIRLLYVTPEKINCSYKTKTLLDYLHHTKRLARIVVDEAHCVSQWGHDFRPDYKELSSLRNQYPSVPIMALTATATKRIQADVLVQLKLNKNVVCFKQSFNRQNLYFEVNPKSKNILTDIVNLINSKFPNDAGIIYCLSRNDCEAISKQLNGLGIQSAYYHAGMSPEDRYDIQTEWQGNTIKIICATIAFGMGIDKPDVRFVIHHSIPKSIEGYYQECGRAGRDGLKASCILFYNYGDKTRMEKMIIHETTGIKEVHLDNLKRIVQYCENTVDCRRVQVLSYFGEIFDKKNCNSACDNCWSKKKYKKIDFTKFAVSITELVRKRPMGFTLLSLMEVLRGCRTKKMIQSGFTDLLEFGCCQKLDRNELVRLLHKLVLDDVLQENLKNLDVGCSITVAYVAIGKNAEKLLQRQLSIIMSVIDCDSTTSQPIPSEHTNQTKKLTSASALLVQKTLFNGIQDLKKVRFEISKEFECSLSSIFSDETLMEMVIKLPETKNEFLNIIGITALKYKKYGLKFSDVIKTFKELKNKKN